MPRLLSWNVNARTRRSLDLQTTAVIALQPDIVALQEITKSAVEPWRIALSEAGLKQSVSSFDGVEDHSRLGGPRRAGVLTASRWPLIPATPISDLPWPERVQSITIMGDAGDIELHNVYVPLGEHPGDIKVRTLEALFRALALPASSHRLLCGDLNAPRVEYPDGRVLTWAQNEPTGSIQKSRGERFDAAERNIVLGLAEFDLVDAFRRLRGYAEPAESWASVYRGRRYPRRLDHIFASASLGMYDVRYLNDWQHPSADRPALSDHAPMLADFEPAT